MKKLHFSLIFLTVIACNAQYRQTTVEIAQKLGYPSFIINLRNKVEDFLNQREVSMKLHVQDLYRVDRNYRAQNLGVRYRDAYDDLVARFDREFERISRKLLVASNELDQENAPEQEKAAFIKSLQQEAVQSIDNLLVSYGAVIHKPIKKRAIPA